MLDEDRHRRSVRLPAFDYGSYGAYFVKIVTHDRVCIFGSITNDAIQLSPLGRIVEEEWRRTGELREGVELDEFVVMPNHIHGIIWITGTAVPADGGTPRRAPTATTIPPRRFGVAGPKSLSEIVNAFKGAVTRRARAEVGIETVWQRGSYEHVVRTERSLGEIRRYIVENSRKWAEDAENPDR